MKAPKGEATKIKLVNEALLAVDDFMTTVQLKKVLAGKVSVEQINVSLHGLKRYHAADVLEASGRLWWYATPTTDTRQRVLDTRALEDHPRKPSKRSRRGKSLPGDAPPDTPRG